LLPAKIVDPPSESDAVEIARIHLAKDATRVRTPTDPASPRANEIDRRHRRHLREAGGWSLHEAARIVNEGRVGVTAKGVAEIAIEELPHAEPFGFYVASCYPLHQEGADERDAIAWRMMSRRVGRHRIENVLQIENLMSKDTEVGFRIYKLG